MPFSVRLKNREQDDLSASRDIADDVSEADFIPYACHYDPETILTKNGELMQTIKIVGFSFESVESEGIDLRETIRKAIHEGLNANNFAVWFHTIRRRKNLSPGGTYEEAFPKYVHETWIKHHDWEHKYTNELFITLVREGETGSIRSVPRFMRSLLLSRDLELRETQLRDAHGELNAAVGRMLAHLESYGARKLSIYKKEDAYYSEPLRFLGKILKLREEEVRLDNNDLSRQLASCDVTFGFDTLEVRAPDQSRRFGAMLTIKEYRELSLAAIDEFLQLPEEFIVSQCMDFIHHSSALKAFKYQHYISGLSDDRELARLSGLQDIIESDHGQPTDYGEHQLTILLLADDIKHLNRYIERTVESLSSLGIVAMREDLKLEECYWAQMPCNFTFLKRLKPINTSRIGGFANLSNFPAGKATDNHWGPAVTVFNTAADTPYFFNFHSGEVGHTTIIGPSGSGKTVLLNFLVSEARKFNNKLFFFDKHRGAEIFLRALGGNYIVFSPKSPQTAMNPLQLEDNPINRNFLLLWVEALMCSVSGDPLTGEEDAAVERAVGQIYALPREQRTLRHFAALMERINPSLAQRLSSWHSGGERAGLFDHTHDALNLGGLVYGFEMTEVADDWYGVAATMLYLVHRMMMVLDGTPSIIVLDEAWGLLDNPIFAPRLHGWLEALVKQNAIAIFATESLEDVSESALSKAVFADIATQIYLPNSFPSEAYQSVFGLSDTEYSFLELMDRDERHFLLKKGDEAIVARLSLEGMDNIMQVLSSTPESLEVMREAIAERGSDPAVWVPLFMERMSAAYG